MAFIITTAVHKLIKLKQRIRAVPGGTSAGKTVGIIEDNLADRFGVEKGHWKLYRSTEYGSKILKRNEPIRDYDMKETTLYFYPEY